MSKRIDYPGYQNTNWNLHVNDDGSSPIEQVQAFVLMDIRDELRKLNQLLHCANFTGIPQTLKSIRRRMGPARPTRKAAKTR